MKLSDKTINLLKNFSDINQSILFKKGNKLRTISVMKNIMAEAEVQEDFPKDFAIYDLTQFLRGVFGVCAAKMKCVVQCLHLSFSLQLHSHFCG